MTDKFRSAGIEINEIQCSKFTILTDFMLEYNKKVNLTRITDENEIIEKHYIDSILPLTMLDVPRGTSVIDVGTGAGFPAVPMKIYRDDLNITMIDSLNKRIVYLDELCKKLDINCDKFHIRSEDAGRDTKFREKYDIATARAVAALNVLCEYCLPFVKINGKFIALKGEKDETAEAEEAIKALGGKLKEIKRYTLPSGDKRCLVVIEKIKETPPKYPRTSALISKKPL